MLAGYGDGDSVNNTGAAVVALGGDTGGHGFVSIQSNGGTGSAGDVLTADGTGNADWQAPTGAGVDAAEDGVVAVSGATEMDFRHGLDVTAPGGGVAQVAVDETELDVIQESLIDAKGDLIAGTANDTAARVAVGTNGQRLSARSTATPGVAWEDVYAYIAFRVVGDLASAYATGSVAGLIEVPYDCTIVGWDLEHDASSTTTIDIKKRAAGGGAAASIVGVGTKPNTSGAQENASTTLTSWATSLSQNDKLYLNVDANSAAKWSTLTLKVKRA